jgi:hypothetical protein
MIKNNYYNRIEKKMGFFGENNLLAFHSKRLRVTLSHTHTDSKKSITFLNAVRLSTFFRSHIPDTQNKSTRLGIRHSEKKMTETSANFNTTSRVADQVDLALDTYEKIDFHWFYSKLLQDKVVWLPFSFKDSKNLESYYERNK